MKTILNTNKNLMLNSDLNSLVELCLLNNVLLNKDQDQDQLLQDEQIQDHQEQQLIACEPAILPHGSPN
jgi:hypothetical protein